MLSELLILLGPLCFLVAMATYMIAQLPSMSIINLKSYDLKEESIDRRNLKRLGVALPVKYRIIPRSRQLKPSRIVPCRTKNISLLGIGLETDIVIIDGLHISHDFSGLFTHTMELEIGTLNMDVIKLSGEVKWYYLNEEPDGYRYQVGIIFHKINEDQKKRLKQLIHHSVKFPVSQSRETTVQGDRIA